VVDPLRQLVRALRSDMDICRRAIVGCSLVAALAGCERVGPEWDATRALDHGDHRALALISVDPHAQLVWATHGLGCHDTATVPLRKVGRVLADGDRYRTYVTRYNEALSSDPRYRYLAHCGPRSRFPDGAGRGVR